MLVLGVRDAALVVAAYAPEARLEPLPVSLDRPRACAHVERA